MLGAGRPLGKESSSRGSDAFKVVPAGLSATTINFPSQVSAVLFVIAFLAGGEASSNLHGTAGQTIAVSPLFFSFLRSITLHNPGRKSSEGEVRSIAKDRSVLNSRPDTPRWWAVLLTPAT